MFTNETEVFEIHGKSRNSRKDVFVKHGRRQISRQNVAVVKSQIDVPAYGSRACTFVTSALFPHFVASRRLRAAASRSGRTALGGWARLLRVMHRRPRTVMVCVEYEA